MSFDIIDTIKDTIQSVIQAVTEPPPPPPAQTAEPIAARVNAATSDPAQRELLSQGYTQAQHQGDGALWQQTEDLATLYHALDVLPPRRALPPGADVPAGRPRAHHRPEQHPLG